jgi:hypothetical protein
MHRYIYALSFETHGNDEKCQMTQMDVAIVILEIR